MMEKPIKSIAVLIVLSILVFSIAGCASSTATAAETVTPISTVESGSAPAGSQLSTSGPWLVFTDRGQLFAVNQDGTGLTPLIPGLYAQQIKSLPNEDILAILTTNGNRLSL